jgi:hypothetical protein
VDATLALTRYEFWNYLTRNILQVDTIVNEYTVKGYRSKKKAHEKRDLETRHKLKECMTYCIYSMPAIGMI